jgi:hypothetical protein
VVPAAVPAALAPVPAALAPVPAVPAKVAPEAPGTDDAADSGALARAPAAEADELAPPPEQPATAAMSIRQGIASTPTRRRDGRGERGKRGERDGREECGEREERAGTARLVRMPLGRRRRTARLHRQVTIRPHTVGTPAAPRRRCPPAAGPKRCAG